ncbi:hypothetical protein Xkoz_02901 [Xenorhabdus kozodoii]|uniref:Uncharacterized protein n=1 Tax=Xenorhabdus kozodoii TaxID=351676 RepID=A0A2D0L5E1_9GAMM|nr:hypothetical protein Xkoz_03527 [Xenorhabdus kozodoii]PHM70893.1 hypothetical protein Xkoz_02901 [Xenorhabdus kozodoii]
MVQGNPRHQVKGLLSPHADIHQRLKLLLVILVSRQIMLAGQVNHLLTDQALFIKTVPQTFCSDVMAFSISVSILLQRGKIQWIRLPNIIKNNMLSGTLGCHEITCDLVICKYIYTCKISCEIP